MIGLRGLATAIVALFTIAYVFLCLVERYTRISIGRFGYLSFRYIDIPSKNGLHLQIGLVGIRLHRPVVTNPTWLTILVKNMVVELDVATAQAAKARDQREEEQKKKQGARDMVQLAHKARQFLSYGLLRWVEVKFVGTSIIIDECGKIELGLLSTRLSPRAKHGSRRIEKSSSLYEVITAILYRERAESRRGLDLQLQCANIRFQLEGQDPAELLDNGLINVWSDFGGEYVFHNVGISCKLGKLYFVVDDLLEFYHKARESSSLRQALAPVPNASREAADQEAERVRSTALSEDASSPDLASLFDIITEVQIHVGFFKASYQAVDITPGGKPATLIATSKDLVLDINRLEEEVPDFRMLFETGTIAHQALVSSISLSVRMLAEDRERTIFSVPMLTMAVKTSSLGYLFRRQATGCEQRNANLTTINTVITSPAVDIHSCQIPILVALLRPRPTPAGLQDHKSRKRFEKAKLPKIAFGFSIHDPSLRVVLDGVSEEGLPPMIIVRLSSFFADFQTVHRDDEYHVHVNARMASGRVYYHSPENEEFNIIENDTTEVKYSCLILPINTGHISVLVDGLRINLCKVEIVDCLSRITESVTAPKILPTKLRVPRSRTPKRPPLTMIPAWIRSAKVQLQSLTVAICGADMDVSPESRGIQLELDSLILEYLHMSPSTATHHLETQEPGEFRSMPTFQHFTQSSIGNDSGHGRPMRNVLTSLEGVRAFTIDSRTVKDTKFPVLLLPIAEISFSETNNELSSLQHLTFYVEDLVIGFSLYKVYTLLQALQVLRDSFFRRPRHHDHIGQEEGEGETTTRSDFESDLEGSVHPTTTFTFEGKLKLLRVKAQLPLDEVLMLDVDRVFLVKRPLGEPQAKLRYLQIYIDSPAYPGKWDRIVSLRDVRISREAHTEIIGDKSHTSKAFVLRTDGLRIRLPHRFVFYELLEAVVNSLKTAVQIVHRFTTQTNDYVLAQRPKQAKLFPRVRLKSRVVAIEIEDDPFESRLGLIFRVGLSEQRMREAREVAFDRKVLKLRQELAKANKSRRPGTHESRRSSFNSRHLDTGRYGNLSNSPRNSEDSSIFSSQPNETSPMFAAEREKLLEHNSRAWILRMRYSSSFRYQKIDEMRRQNWGKDEVSNAAAQHEEILEISNRPPLFAMHFLNVDIVLDKPSFGLSHLPDYLHRVGRGLPKDTQYTLLAPFNLNWKMDEARIQVRDYPLPLLHIPPLHELQKTGYRAWEFCTDLVIAEEFPGPSAIRHSDVCVVPPDTGRPGSPAFNVEVQRTVNPVKIYAEVLVDINSSIPTRVHWGTSMQPGVADAFRILDTLSKPPIDPSPKLGFWDKIGLSMHLSVKMAWKHDGDMHVTIKGSGDPYVVLGGGAGLTKVFRGNVRWHIGADQDPRKLMEVMCDEYMLLIPDFSHRSSGAELPREKDSDVEPGKRGVLHHYHMSRKELRVQKILMKLTGDVRWTAGLTFERHCEDSDCADCGGRSKCRIWTFIPHWEVKLVTPQHSKLPGGKVRDAYPGFRSHFIHGQISVTSRARKDYDESYNTIHLTPKAFAHFFDWIHCFSGNTSLPIRAGPLFPADDAPKQKFGQHLMTLKYNLQLEPLYLSHIYKSTHADEPGKIDMTGVKARIDSFTLDLHQRKEEMIVKNKVLETERKSQHMAIYKAQVDLRNTDLRVLTAAFEADTSEETHGEIVEKDPLDPSAYRGEAAAGGMFHVSEEDLAWIDMDDFTELDTILPEISPICRIIPLAYSPRSIYDRDTTHHEGHAEECHMANVPRPDQKFGMEKTHYCSMVSTDGNSSGSHFGAQHELWDARYGFLEKELRSNEDRMTEVRLALEKIPTSRALNEEYKILTDHHKVLTEKSNFVKTIMKNVQSVFHDAVVGSEVKSQPNPVNSEEQFNTSYLRSLRREVETFDNRFVVHDIQMKWNNTLRNSLIRYVQQVNQRRGFSYYMSQKAVRFLSDLVDEQLRNKTARDQSEMQDPANPGGNNGNDSDRGLDEDVEKLIKQLLDDRKNNFFVADETAVTAHDIDKESEVSGGLTVDVDESGDDYQTVNDYILRLVAPQIQLQSEKDKESAVVLAAQSMQMKIFAIKDKTVAADDVSALVHRKFSVAMSNAQFFYANQRGFNGAIANLLTQNSYGAVGDSYWPPWVPIESVYDFEHNPRAFERIVDRTSAQLTYVKNNNLRIKQNDRHESDNQLGDNGSDDLVDSITINFPKFNLSANSAQYYALFTIALDLLMYSEPLQKERNEQIEKILLAADFSDLSGAPEMVRTLQKRIRNLNDFKTQFKLHAQRHDPQCKSDEIKVEKELEQCEDELFLLMKSIATAQQKREDRGTEVMPAMRWHLKADEILWHLMEGNDAFIDFGLSKASFKRTDVSDSSNFNTLEIEMMQGINLSPDPVFAQLFAPYFGKDRTVVDARRSKMVRIYWYMLEAIGGISVCDHFELNLFPLRLQMEHDVGKKLFAYIFPDKQKKKDEDSESESDDSASGQDDGVSTSDSDESEERNDSSAKSRKRSKMSFGGLRHSASLSRLSLRSSHSRLREASSTRSHDSDAASGSRRLSDGSSTSSARRAHKGKLASGRPPTVEDKKKDDTNSDDLTAMMNRANKNMSLVYVKVPSAILALSYKGAKAKNFVDVTDFVFKLPTIEYRNKTWSYLDLAEHLKREVIKAVLAHTGSLLKDKMIHHRKSKNRQPTLQKQITSYNTFVPAEANELDVQRAEDGTAASNSGHNADFVLQSRTSTAETSSIHGDGHGHGLFNNAIGRHIQHLSHIARHKDGLNEDSAESTLKKTRMLLGKFIDKAK